MALHQQPSPPGSLHQHHPSITGHPQVNGTAALQAQPATALEYLQKSNEAAWLQIGAVSELQGDFDGAAQAYERAMKFNQWSIPAMQAISSMYRTREQFPAAIEWLKRILQVEQNNGDVWGSLGHCYLMMDDLQQAYSAYQQALYHLRDPKEPKLWYGIGILYDRYGSLEHAEEAFSQVMRMQPDFEKANEIYFRLGIIYKQQQKFQSSLECFKYIVNDPPRPLTEEDIWFQIGHVHEQQKDYDSAKAAYMRVLERQPDHAKVLQQLGWLHHQQSGSFNSQEQAIQYLEKSVEADGTDAQSWYLLGRCYMSQQKYPKAYEAYQQAVYRDGRNPTFWCSIGVLYYQINQYRDALDAYSRAIRLNPNISEVWYDLGTLYESCNNQTNDALDAYQRAADLDPLNVHIKARLQLLRSGQPTSGMPNQNSQPLPQDVHPQAYQPAAVNGPPGPQWGAPASAQAPPGPPPGPVLGNSDWNRHRLADIQPPQPQPPPQQLNPYDHKDAMRGPPPHRQPSPRTDPFRYHELQRQTPMRRGFSPSPKVHHAAPNPYQGPQGLPQNLPQPLAPQQQPLQHQQPPPTRITNPNYGGSSSSVPQVATPGINAPPPQIPPGQGPMPPYGRMNTPPPEVRPIVEARPPSPGSKYPYQSHNHHPNLSGPGAIASGAPAPASALAAAEAAARDRDNRTPIAPKRLREWDDDHSSQKKPASDENRARLDDRHGRRPSPPDGKASPQPRSASEARRMEDQRRANENYHPSEAAHHPQALPSIHHTPSLPPMPEPVKEERREQYEPASRKMDVDEDYDDSGEDDKRNIHSGSTKNSPRAANDVGNTHGEPIRIGSPAMVPNAADLPFVIPDSRLSETDFVDTPFTPL